MTSRGDDVGVAPTPAPPPEPGGLPEAPGAGLGRAAASGALWLTAQKWLIRLSGLVTVAILARLVTPQEFGVVAAASAVVPFILLLSDLGLSTYLVQVKTTDQRMLSTGFWFSLGAAIVLGGVLLGAVPLLTAMIGVPDAAPVLRVLICCVPLVVVASVPTALLRRQMQFRRLAVQGAVAAVFAQVVAIGFALAGTGAWALVAQAISSILIMTPLAWIAARWRPSFLFSRADFVTMARFGYKVVAVELVAVLRNWAETAIVAMSLGTSALGFLSIAQRLVQVAQDLGGSAVAPVSVVVLSKVRDSPERLRNAYQRASRLTYGAVTPILTFVAVGAPVLVPLLFGPQWEGSITVTRGLAIAGILTLGAFLDHGLFYALGRAGTWFVYATLTDLVTVGATALAVAHGLTAVAWAFVGVAVVATAVRWGLVGRQLGIQVRELAGSFGAVAACVVASAGAGLLTMALVDGPLLLRAAATGIVILATHLTLMRLTMASTMRDALELGPVPPRVRSMVQRLARLSPA
jgi:O-antigen/teichoic acid export membrane protein